MISILRCRVVLWGVLTSHSMSHSPQGAGLCNNECTNALAAGVSLMLSAKTHAKISQLQVHTFIAVACGCHSMLREPDYVSWLLTGAITRGAVQDF